MKSKFYLCALFCAVVGTSVISSCKDTDEDLYLNFKNDLQAEKKKIAELRKDLDNLINTINSCECEGKDAIVSAVVAKMKEEDDYQALLAAKDQLLAWLNSHIDITNVNIEQVVNPAFGTFALPFGIKSGVLMSYYSNKAASELFPVTKTADPADGLTVDEQIALDVDANPINLSDPANVNMTLGKVSLSINPVDSSYLDLTPVLVGGCEGVTFSKLVKFEDQLMFGYTRVNYEGLYVTEATVSDYDKVEKISLNVKEKAKTIKDAIKGKGIDGAAIADVVYSTINNVCSRNAIKVTSMSSAISSYDLAVALVNPMGLETVQSICDSEYATKLKNILKKTTFTGEVVVDGHNGTVTIDMPKTLKRILEKTGNFVENFAHYVQPAMFAKSADKLQLLSMNASAPTKVEKTITLHATSYSSEFIVPFAKKFVAITKINGAPVNKEKNQALNKKLAEAQNGPQDLVISLENLEAGVYELAYSVLDYAGKAEICRYYFEVK